MKKTNAARLLDSQHIMYELVEYPVDENDLSALNVAAKLGQNVEHVFKTLVLRGNATGIFVAVVPGDAEVNLKKAAKLSGNKNAEMVHMKELPGLTGYIRGACSPLGMKKTVPRFYPRNLPRFWFYLCQRRDSRHAAQTRSQRFNYVQRRDGLQYHRRITSVIFIKHYFSPELHSIIFFTLPANTYFCSYLKIRFFEYEETNGIKRDQADRLFAPGQLFWSGT